LLDDVDVADGIEEVRILLPEQRDVLCNWLRVLQEARSYVGRGGSRLCACEKRGKHDPKWTCFQ
jgi:hypothetical protein